MCWEFTNSEAGVDSGLLSFFIYFFVIITILLLIGEMKTWDLNQLMPKKRGKAINFLKDLPLPEFQAT